MNKSLPIAGTLLLGAGMLQGWAAPVNYTIPATQEEFETNWATVTNEDTNTWEWVDAEIPYAQIKPLNDDQSAYSRPTEAKKAATLYYKTPIEMKAGDKFSLQVKGASHSWNDEEVVYIMVGTDPNDMKPISEQVGTFKIYPVNSSASFPSFVVKTADTSNDRIYTATEDGSYYIGVQSNFARDKDENKLLVVQSLIVEKQVDYPQKVTGAKGTASPDGDLSVTLEWTWPTKTKNDNTISSPVGGHIYRVMHLADQSEYSWSPSKATLYTPECLIATVENGVAGQKATFVDNAENSIKPIEEEGRYYYYIAPFVGDDENSECTSASIITVKWVGEGDRPYNPLNGSGKAVGTSIELTYKNRILAYNDGPLKAEKLYNRIERKKDDGEYVVIEEKYLEGQIKEEIVTYTDSNLDGFGTYSYQVYIGYGDELSNPIEIKNIVGGGGLAIPYSEDFTSEDSFQHFSVDGGEYSGKWVRSNESAKLSTYNNVKCTLFTPALKLEAGKTYKVSINAWGDPQSSGSSSGGNYGYGYGDDDDDDYYGYGYGDDDDTEEVAGSYPLSFVAATTASATGATYFANLTITGTSNKKQALEGFFAPEESGNYFIGFTSSTSSYKGVYLDDISIVEATVIPAKVADLGVVADAAGADSAEISFTVPSKSNAGVTLESLSKVVVKRYDEAGDPVEVKTYSENVEPGMAVSFTDEVPEAGMYSYGVVSYLGDEASVESKSENLWIGYDVPKAMSSLSVHVSLNEKATPVITWDALSGTVKTLHGGYIDMDNLKYRVYRVDARNAEAEKVMIGETAELSFTDNELHEAPYGEYRYGVAALNGAFEGKAGETTNKINGGIVDVNYEPDLTDDNCVESFEGRGFIAENGISWKNGGESMMSDNHVYLPSFRYAANETTGVKATMTVSRGSAEYEELLEVYLCTIETEKSDLRSEDEVSRPSATTILGNDNMKLIQTVPVHAMEAAPEVVSVPIDLNGNGKYRIAFRCASDYNKKLTIHTVKVEPYLNTATGVEEISMEDADADAEYYTLQGLRVNNPEAGIYIRVLNGKASKVMLK